MSANTQKIRDAFNKIHAEMEKDPAIREEAKKNYLRVLRDRGGLNLDEIIHAHELEWGCPDNSQICDITLRKPPG